MLTYFPNGMERYLAGGVFIGVGVALLFALTGRPGGASTFFSSSWTYLFDTPFFRQPALREGRDWRRVYALGLVLGGAVYLLLGLPVEPSQVPVWQLVTGGLLVGFGARLGGGCTSGHGICGMASLSGGSLVMVLIFLTTAIVTALAMTALGIAAPGVQP